MISAQLAVGNQGKSLKAWSMDTIRTWKLVSDYSHQYQQSENNPSYCHTVTQQCPTTWHHGFSACLMCITSNNNDASRQHKCQPHSTDEESGTRVTNHSREQDQWYRNNLRIHISDSPCSLAGMAALQNIINSVTRKKKTEMFLPAESGNLFHSTSKRKSLPHEPKCQKIKVSRYTKLK